ncbi:RagB/SusD family nutrient uptake outer membrane protein [Puteibacter caeruleilacunae]|nr:RagB/SusD family nutrient uptake outer membrane protein [Puteibacter caeruleilacunae]
MKIIKLFIIASTLWLVGCDSYLDVEPEGTITKDEFWTAKEEVEGVVAASYAKLRTTVTETFVWGELRGDLFAKGEKISTELELIKDGDIYPENNYVKYSDFYKVINYVNILLDNIDDVKTLDGTFTTEEYNYWKSEALFIRSLCYYYLAATFRDVPMPLVGYDSDSQELYLGQTPQKKVFNQIYNDMKEAVSLSKDFDENNNLHSHGRATTAACQALLANICLWIDKSDEAITVCDQILANPYYTLMGMDYWFNNFYPGNSNENIFELEYFEGDQENDLANYTSSYYDGGEKKYFECSSILMGLYESGDIRGSGGSFIEEYASLWKYTGAEVESNHRVFRDEDANWIYYRLADVYLMKAEAAIMSDRFDDAIAMINTIRLRAGIEEYVFDTSTETNKEFYYQLLLDERARELVGEGKRWFDLVRIASRNDFEFKNLLTDAVLNATSVGVKSSLSLKIENTDFWYLPIHESELKVNNNLVQNPYYSF